MEEKYLEAFDNILNNKPYDFNNLVDANNTISKNILELFRDTIVNKELGFIPYVFILSDIYFQRIDTPMIFYKLFY